MRINCGPTYQERYEAKQQWHRWFAWRPVRVGSNDCRWLEAVERKGTPPCWPSPMPLWEWEYRSTGTEE